MPCLPSIHNVVAAALLVLHNPISSRACSDFLVTPGASVDGSAIIAYNADDVGLKGVLYHYPATENNKPSHMIPIFEWDSGVSGKTCDHSDRLIVFSDSFLVVPIEIPWCYPTSKRNIQCDWEWKRAWPRDW
jgi:hypothetical protein